MPNDDIVVTVNELIECCMDGEFGYLASAETMRNEETKRLLLQRAGECGAAAAELRPIVVSLGGTPEDGGSASGALQRGWVVVKGTLSGHSDLAILEDTERAEDKAIQRYQTAMRKELPASVRAVVEAQYLGVQRNHAQIKALLEAERLAAAHH
jgi:uncharacterized protein (TIGR02284 family)